MKKNPCIRLLVFLLLAAFAVSLTGCIGRNGSPSATEPSTDSGTAAPAEVPAPSGELEKRWKVEPLPGPAMEDDVRELVLIGDKLYAACSGKAGPSLYISDLSGASWQALELPAVQGDAAEGEESSPVAEMNLSGLTVHDSGAYLLTTSYTEQGQEVALFSWDASGDFLGEKVLEGAGELFFSSCALLGDKLLLGDSFYSLQGEPLGTIADADKEPSSNYSAAGDRLFAYTASDTGEGVTLWEMDSEGKLRNPMELPDVNFYSLFSCVSESTPCLATDDGLWTLDTASGEKTQILSWLEVGVDPNRLGSVCYTDNGDIYLTNSGEIYHLSSYQGPARQVLEMAVGAGTQGIYLDQAVSLFNQSSEEYMVSVRYIYAEDTEALRTELTTGQGPDILFLGSTVDEENQFNRFELDSGLCADLLPYIDADLVYNRDCFLPGLLDSALENGHLYALDPGFELYTIVAPASLAEKAGNWTVDSLLELRATLPEGVTLFDGYARSSLASIVLNLASVEYADRQSASCFFDDPSFVQWLQIWNSYTDDDMANADSAALWATTVYGGLPAYLRENFGEDYAYMGFPGREGPVQLIRGLGGFSILASSQHPDGAWAFLRTLLDIRVQTGAITNFTCPVTREAFDQWAQERMDPDSYTTFTQEDKDRLEAAVAQAKGWICGDVLSDIISEEAEKAFSNGRPLEETAAAIQSRAKIYMAEQYG